MDNDWYVAARQPYVARLQQGWNIWILAVRLEEHAVI
jgi:hypothetical protein